MVFLRYNKKRTVGSGGWGKSNLTSTLWKIGLQNNLSVSTTFVAWVSFSLRRVFRSAYKIFGGVSCDLHAHLSIFRSFFPASSSFCIAKESWMQPQKPSHNFVVVYFLASVKGIPFLRKTTVKEFQLIFHFFKMSTKSRETLVSPMCFCRFINNNKLFSLDDGVFSQLKELQGLYVTGQKWAQKSKASPLWIWDSDWDK